MSALEIQKCIHDLPIEEQYNFVEWAKTDLAREVELALFDRRLAEGCYDELVHRARAERAAGIASTELR